MRTRAKACLVVLALLPLAGCCRNTSSRPRESHLWAREALCGGEPSRLAREWWRDAKRGSDGRVSQSDLWWQRVRRGECD